MHHDSDRSWIIQKAKLPGMSNRLITDFDVEDTLDTIYLLPHNVASESYMYGPSSTDCLITYCL